MYGFCQLINSINTVTEKSSGNLFMYAYLYLVAVRNIVLLNARMRTALEAAKSKQCLFDNVLHCLLITIIACSQHMTLNYRRIFTYMTK